MGDIVQFSLFNWPFASVRFLLTRTWHPSFGATAICHLKALSISPLYHILHDGENIIVSVRLNNHS